MKVMNKNKVLKLMVVSRSAFAPPKIGGAARYSISFAVQIADKYQDSVEISFVGQHEPISKNSKIKFYKIKNNFNLETNSMIKYFIRAFFQDLIISIKAVQILWKNKYDFVVFNSNISCILAKLFTKNKAKFFYVCHDTPSIPKIKNNSILNFIVRFLNNYLLEMIAISLSDRVIAVSPTVKYYIKKLFKRESFLLFPYPSILNWGYINKDIYRISLEEQILKKYNLTENEYIISVGDQNKRKKFDNLIKSFFHLKDKNLKLVLVGNGPDHSNLISLTEALKLKDKVLFLTDLNNEDLITLYKKAKLTVLVSISEGFPTVIVESLSLGTPVALFLKNVGEELLHFNSEYLRIFTNIDENYIAQELNKLIDNKYDMVKRNNIKKFANETFNVDNFAEKAMSILNLNS
ncbi:MAG: glycosyltransferase [Nitrososphaerota archaeon]